MMRRVLIVDDEPLARERLRDLLAGHGDFTVVGECDDGESAVTVASVESPDALFIDVQMPHMDGFAVAEALLDIFDPTRLPLLIFVTAHDRYALRAFEASALDYLLKPVGRARFEQTIERARRHFELRDHAPDARTASNASVTRLVRETQLVSHAERFAVRRGSVVSFLRSTEIDWIDAAGNYVRLHASGTAYMLRSAISAFAERLDPKAFLRVHRSAIVNLDRVTQVRSADHGEYVVTLSDGTRLTVSRTYSPRLRTLIREVS
jgi:two-component system LytT family response regulator